MDVKLHYYSERGMVDSILHAISNPENGKCKELLKSIYDINNNQLFADDKIKIIKKVDLFNEFSLGKQGFGEPDLIIKVALDDDQLPIILFVEAKIDTFARSVTVPVEGENCYKNHTSDINFQFRLKKRFVDAFFNEKLNEKGERIVLDNGDKDKSGNEMDHTSERKLEKPELVNYLINFVFKGINKNNYKEQIYYVSLTNDDNNPYETERKIKGKSSRSIEEYLPFEKDSAEYNHLAYFKFKEIKDILKDCNEYNMFEGALDLKKNIY